MDNQNPTLNRCPHIWTLRPRQNGRHFADDIFKCISFNENVWIPIKISLKFVPKGPINNSPSLVQMMVWRRPDAKPLSEPMMVSLLTDICVTRPQWVKAKCHKLHKLEKEKLKQLQELNRHLILPNFIVNKRNCAVIWLNRTQNWFQIQ